MRLSNFQLVQDYANILKQFNVTSVNSLPNAYNREFTQDGIVLYPCLTWHTELDFNDEFLRALTDEAIDVLKRLLSKKFAMCFGSVQRDTGRLRVAFPTVNIGGSLEYSKAPADTIDCSYPHHHVREDSEILHWFCKFCRIECVSPKNNDLWEQWGVTLQYPNSRGTGATISAAVVEAEMNLGLLRASCEM